MKVITDLISLEETGLCPISLVDSEFILAELEAGIEVTYDSDNRVWANEVWIADLQIVK